MRQPSASSSASPARPEPRPPVCIRVVLRHQLLQQGLACLSRGPHKGGGEGHQEQLQQRAQLARLGGCQEVEDGGAGGAGGTCGTMDGTVAAECMSSR